MTTKPFSARNCAGAERSCRNLAVSVVRPRKLANPAALRNPQCAFWNQAPRRRNKTKASNHAAYAEVEDVFSEGKREQRSEELGTGARTIRKWNTVGSDGRLTRVAQNVFIKQKNCIYSVSIKQRNCINSIYLANAILYKPTGRRKCEIRTQKMTPNALPK